MKNKKDLFSPLMEKYSKALRENPKSRVFAPLAEIYRRYAMHDKAFSTLKKGISHNPDYTLGYLGLAECYWDREEYQMSYNTLRPLIHLNRDNLKMQKLFANVCEKLNYLEEALNTYKYILLMNPKDKRVKKEIKSLEKNFSYIETTNSGVEHQRKHQAFHIENLSGSPDFSNEIADSWEEVNTYSSFVQENLENDMSQNNDKSEGRNGLMDVYDSKFSFSEREKEEENPLKTSQTSELEESLWDFYRALKSKSIVRTA